MVKWVLGLMIVALCVNCSIEKRHYTSGYYIKWHKRHASSKNQAKAEKQSDTSLVVVAEDTVLVIPVEDSIPAIAQQEEKPEVDAVDDSEKKEHVKPADLPKKERKFEPLGVLSSKILVVDFLIMLLGEMTMTPRQYTIFSAVLLAGLILAFVLGIISMVRYLRNPSHYKFNIWAILGILVPLLFFILMLTGAATLF
ncbi:MAG: hypothetical protein A3D31_10155 [Candidatus Fluviicola riflensis]|nr:MAG: hypothetical protein CHH17_14575 [Candidatus Fluviicola riflensis]OGS77365.1 MAG: hypothetical protein A3D31_10155 [Candidatus Fluviicola riflensis]OGS83945.1 MAG: hypothetical protein A3E30_11555 [Fluviicola sp. RIFCSPHIGHO2_12_FULL_43_24]OGS84432.1 MAG: hypothetical protein A2724_07095 [Fluviicola sp. RIFCSPHIGHO2_01_FULL_43_53]